MKISCREATRLVSQGLDRELGLAQRLALRLHLAFCDGCANVARQLAFLSKAMERLADRSGKP